MSAGTIVALLVIIGINLLLGKLLALFTLRIRDKKDQKSFALLAFVVSGIAIPALTGAFLLDAEFWGCVLSCIIYVIIECVVLGTGEKK